MNCYCHSKQLYRKDYTNPEQKFKVDGVEYLKRRAINEETINNSHPHMGIQQKIAQTAQLWLPNQIDRVSWNQITFNPLWFHQKYLSKNMPCIITDVFQGDDIFQRWAEPQYLTECMQGQTHSISLTPDGYADSISGQYFIEPHETKASLKEFFNHEELYPNSVPYIQHQNGNLIQQFQALNCQVSQEVVKRISQNFFKGKDPDAENLWLGYDKSVSSLHKDPYQNFYMSIVGQKHFTLMPPHSILCLQQQQFKSARWGYQNGQFKCSENGNKNNWICVNPDLDKDVQRFEKLGSAQKYHVVVKKEEMLYLPSLWYHQVSQCRVKDPHVMAINYWFDMEFAQNYSLYETCRSLRNLK